MCSVSLSIAVRIGAPSPQSASRRRWVWSWRSATAGCWPMLPKVQCADPDSELCKGFQRTKIPAAIVRPCLAEFLIFIGSFASFQRSTFVFVTARWWSRRRRRVRRTHTYLDPYRTVSAAITINRHHYHCNSSSSNNSRHLHRQWSFRTRPF